MGFCVWTLFCYSVLCVLSSFAISLMGEESALIALIVFLVSCDCYSVAWLFLTVPWVGMQCVIVVFPDHTHLLFQTQKPEELK